MAMLNSRKILILALLLCTTFSSAVFAEAKIVDVDFAGLDTVSENAARSNLNSIEGTEFSRQALSDDIKQLYKSGLFQDVQVQKTNVAGGIKLTFVVQEKKIVGKLTITGNKKIKTEDIENALKIREFDAYDKAKVGESKTKILALYEEKGYFLADVDVEVSPFADADNQVELAIRIHEGRAVKIRRISFIGNKEYSDKELRQKLHTKEKNALAFLTGAGKLEDQNFDLDMRFLAYFYYDNGYLDIKIGEPAVTLTRDKQGIYITIPVSEGEQYRVASVDVAGDILTSKDELLDSLKLKVGDIYKKSLEEQDAQKIVRLYGDQAYINVDFEPQIHTNPATREANVTYYIRKNAKVRVDKIIIKGNDVTRDKVIRREMRVFENSYISLSAIERSRARLMQLGYFKEVNISTPHSNEPDKVNIVIDVVENNTGEFQVGGGFSTLESFMFNARVRKDNFLGRGLSMSGQFLLSKLQQNVQLYYKDWYFLDSKWALTLNGFSFISSINPSYDERQIGGSIGFGREIFDFFRGEVEYNIADISVNNFSAQVPDFFKETAGGLVSSIGTSLSYDKRDNRISARKGTYTAASMTYADDWLGTEHPFVRTIFDNRFYVPLPLKMVLRGRQMIGYVNSLNDDPVNLSNRFYMGGPDSLRGYQYKSIGPTLSVPSSAKGQDRNFSFGGDKMLQGNLEVEIPLFAKAGFYGVTFLDAGNAFGETENYDLTNLRYNYGLGLRWQSPIGPMRFEWGFPIGRKTGEDGSVFNFMIGPNF